MSRSQSDKSSLIKKLSESKSFCVYPWIHLHVSPTGISGPCCVSKSCSDSEYEGLGGNAKDKRLMDMVNSPKMNQLRLDMINGVEPDECAGCFNQERAGLFSFRNTTVYRLNSYGDIADITNDDGSLSKFDMRYFDMRFSNICNFKCRTCGQEFSSQWEQENLRHNVKHSKPFTKGANKELLQDVLEQIDVMETAYFAGGEPLIMEEHYIMLEEMIRRNRTDIALQYNTNLSNLHFKNKDLIGLWKHFKKPIDVSASIDHYGDRAEYIRHGTNWGTVESNFKALREIKNVTLTINTVLSVFNYMTMKDFHEYLIDKDMFIKNDHYYGIHAMTSPLQFTCHMLPDNLTEIADNNMQQLISILGNIFNHDIELKRIKNLANWAKSKTITYDYIPTTTDSDIEHGFALRNIDSFKNEINRLDKIRGEDFCKTFPELAAMMDL